MGPPTTPIRVAIIGLSSAAKTAWASRAHLPYLLSPTGQSKYQIVALLNSSEAAARAAIEAYDLPPDTRAYGDPAALAADADVDLVVCNTRVDKHYETVLPSVKAGKDVFVEWPLAQDVRHAKELAEAARVGGGRTVVGLQGGLAAVALKLRALLEEGRIGKVLSSEVRAFGGLNDRETMPEGLQYFSERAVGGNIYTIGFAHLLEVVQGAIGELGSAKGDFHLQRPDVPIKDATGKVIRTVRSEVPDLIHLAGKWDESSITQKNATLHYRLRRGQGFPGEPALNWTINGEKGEIRIISPETAFLQLSDETVPRVIEIHNFETNEVDKVEWNWEQWQNDIDYAGRGIGALYEGLAEVKGTGAKEHYPTFNTAVKRHELLENLLAEWKA
ncbi:uncharacterized protein B0H64DRAFT_478452 [Chaetomium fimeti]|uniref:Gfo/Idh/MocA-like oxidoreductase N-terminal domain-containing protein n=1 Tax=Chaetomium fimeti TaxID=1854472 RepID=A0AAE0H771_9PEZI|nr:hypothetical protein B0H64DRAFT_478452 [Chaetomium fimeti]